MVNSSFRLFSRVIISVSFSAREDDAVLPLVEILQLAEKGRNSIRITVPIRVRPGYAMVFDRSLP